MGKLAKFCNEYFRSGAKCCGEELHYSEVSFTLGIAPYGRPAVDTFFS